MVSISADELFIGPRGVVKTKALNFVREYSLRTAADIVEFLRTDDLMNVPGLGPKTVNYIEDSLRKAGYSIPQERGLGDRNNIKQCVLGAAIRVAIHSSRFTFTQVKHELLTDSVHGVRVDRKYKLSKEEADYLRQRVPVLLEELCERGILNKKGNDYMLTRQFFVM
jgi:hypothetical protein